MRNYKISSCSNCKHAVLDNGVQTACAVNKLNQLIESKFTEFNTESGHYDLFKVCLSRNKEISDVKTPVGYIFILNDVSDIDILKSSIDKALEKNPMWIGIVHDLVDLASDVIIKFASTPCPINIICNHSPVHDIISLDMFMKNYKNGWTIVNVIGEEFDIGLIDNLNLYLENTKSAIALIKLNDDSVNGMCFYNFLYKYLKGSLLEVNPTTQEVIDKTYEQKVLDASPNMLITWKEINEINDSFTSGQ